MLPNWLYGKSKSKLASILGGGGGTPPDYNQVKAQVTQNAEDIALLSDALDNKAALTQITNPNILHNPWFQVNQRGFITSNNTGYSVDRWRIVKATTGDTTFTLNSDGTITINNSLGETEAYLIQRRTTKTISRITGRTITMSAMLSDGTVRSGSGAYVATENRTYYEDDDIKLWSQAQTLGQLFILSVKAGKTVTIKALKLELGSVSTLAMDTAPDMATELLKCQRYFEKIIVFEHNILDVQASYDRDYYITPKRTNGTLTTHSVNNTAGKISFYINNQWEDGDYTALEWDGPLKNTIRFGAQIPAGSFLKSDIVIDAEL